MKRYAKQTALALAMALTVTSVAPATASAAAKPKFSKTYGTVKKGKNYVYTLKNLKKGIKVKWTITGTGKSCVSFSKTKAVYSESTTVGKKSTHSSNRIYIRKNKSEVVKANVKATVTINKKKYTVSDKIAIAKSTTTPSTTTPSATPATETPSTTPATTATVAPSGAPATTATVAPSGAPATSATPAPSGAPATSATPAPSGAPATSATPAPSGAPATSATPAPSGAPGTSATPAPTATVAPITAGASAVVDNRIQVDGYDNLVLVNDNAIVTVTVRDENKQPLPNKTVVFALNDTIAGQGVEFEAKGNTVVTTNQEGKASFVVANKQTVSESTSIANVGSVKYTATVVGTNYSATGRIGFAAIDLGGVNMDIPTKTENGITVDALNPGVNAEEEEALYYPEKAGRTTNLSNSIVDFVRAQQVSAANTTSGAVTFSVNPTLKIPSLRTENDKAKEFTEPVNQKSEKYGTYCADGSEKYAIIPLKVDTTNLQYATLNFNSIQISEYTKLTIAAYSDEKCTDRVGDELVYAGPKEQSNFAYQIPLTDQKQIKAIKVTITSAGQVETDKNAGFDIKDITGVYKEGTIKASSSIALPNAKIAWKAVTPVYSNEMVAEDNLVNAIKQLDTTEDKTGHKFVYQVPVFPYTGNAVIKESDSAGKIVGYYLAPTERSIDPGKTNTNVINYNGAYGGVYKATKEEATNIILDGVTTDGNKVTVDSKLVGSTTLQGTISVDGLGNDQLDATNSKLYTSVHWNPIPTVEETQSSAFLAFAGQKITVHAQVVDKNGNPVSLSGKKVSYTYTNEQGEAIGINNLGDNISIISNQETDVNGKATLILSSPKQNLLQNIKASIENKSFDVKLYVGDSAAAVADLYWVDADLEYKADATKADDAFVGPVGNKVLNTVRTSLNNPTTRAAVSSPLVGTPWEYAVKAVASKIDDTRAVKDTANSKLTNWKIVKVSGLNIGMTSAEDNKGKYDFSKGNGVVTAQSEYATYGESDIIKARINEDSVTSNVVFTLQNNTTKELVEYKCVGEGSTNVNAKLELPIDWQIDGVGVSMLVPSGTTVARTVTGSAIETVADASVGTTEVYVRIVDKTGKNVQKGKKVYFKSSNTSGESWTAAEGYATSTDENNKRYVLTDDNGIARIKVTNTNKTIKSSIISAEVDGVDAVSTTINWTQVMYPEFSLLNAQISANDNKVVELKFNNEVTAVSAKAKGFIVQGTNSKGEKVTYNVKAAKVNGTKVDLTLDTVLAAGEYTVSVIDSKENGVDYKLTDLESKTIKNSTVHFYTTNADYSVDTCDADGTIKISGFRSPVDLTKKDDVSDADYQARIKDVFVVTVDGTAVDVVSGNFNSTNGNVELNIGSVGKGKTVRVYHMGYMDSTKSR